MQKQKPKLRLVYSSKTLEPTDCAKNKQQEPSKPEHTKISSQQKTQIMKELKQAISKTKVATTLAGRRRYRDSEH